MTRRPVLTASLVLSALLVAAVPAYADTITGTPGNDVLMGTEGDDRIDAETGDDSVSGLGGHDLLFGEAGADTLDGGDGPDSLGGGTGADLLSGGHGDDRLTVSSQDRASGGPQADDVVARNGRFVVHGDSGADRLSGTGTGRQLLFGDGGNDLMEVQQQQHPDSRLFGGAGDDEVYAFDDESEGGVRIALLSGGPGNDSVGSEARVLSGGPGDDSLYSSVNGGEPKTVSCGDGVDFVTSFSRDDLFDVDCETVQLHLVVGADGTLVGTRYNDYVDGTFGDDTISTLGGDDQVDARFGSDVVDLGPGDDYSQNWGSHAETDADSFTCGPGRDEVYIHRADEAAADCEVVDYRD